MENLWVTAVDPNEEYEGEAEALVTYVDGFPVAVSMEGYDRYEKLQTVQMPWSFFTHLVVGL